MRGRQRRRQVGFDYSEMKAVFQYFDENADGHISYQEFLTGVRCVAPCPPATSPSTSDGRAPGQRCSRQGGAAAMKRTPLGCSARLWAL